MMLLLYMESLIVYTGKMDTNIAFVSQVVLEQKMEHCEDTRTEFQKKIGVGERQYRFGKHSGTNNVKPVVIEEGSRAGKVGGYQTEHWSGRVDATVLAPSITLKTQTQESD